MESYIIGVDGGGTKTHAVFVSLDGRIIGQTTVGASNYQQAGKSGIQTVCRQILEEAEKKGISQNAIQRWVLGLAGAGRPADQKAVKEAVEELGFRNRVTVESDGYIALMGAFVGESGIILIAGTGSICYGLNTQGVMTRSGGWGYLLGDEGSGYFIANQALIAALKDLDGRGQKTILRQKLESLFDVATIDLLVPKIYTGELKKEDIAGLAPMVFQTAAENDAVAKEIIERAGRELGKMAVAVAKNLRLDGETIRLAPIGSVLENQKEVLQPYIETELHAVSDSVIFQDPHYPPAIGAAIAGLKEEKIKLSLELLENISTSYESLQAV
ncbi:MAG: hypothetical protein GXO76_02350 [Calditrichaeota bacterium]|nr:hypothetical protein [Calditrichota bacterium]